MKNYNMILTEKQQNYQLYCQVKLININLTVEEEILPSNISQMIEEVKFTFSPLEKAFEKQRNRLMF